MNLENTKTLKALFLPGGILLLCTVGALQGGWIAITRPAVDSYYLAVFIAGILLAWRFRSSRILLTFLVLLLSHRAMEFFSLGRTATVGPGRVAMESVAFLLPLNFMAISLARERGVTVSAAAPRLMLIFLQSVFVAVICRPGVSSSPKILHAALLGENLFRWTRIPQPALLLFVIALAALLGRFLLYGKAVDCGLFWSLASAFCSLQSGGIGRRASAYFATSGLILIGSIIETSYVLAYHDELTGLPARRAFNEAVLRLQHPYSVAMVDIDHFKRFNDSFGHGAGDQVLRMVAARLARVRGGGNAFRVGGEEFCILFPEKSAPEAAPYLEMLRQAVEESAFRLRGVPERRNAARGPDRRVATRGSRAQRSTTPLLLEKRLAEDVSVTVSIGLAESGARTAEVERIIQAADKALYRAKKAGRNRLEVSGKGSARRARRSIA